MKKVLFLIAVVLSLVITACSENSVNPIQDPSADRSAIIQKTSAMFQDKSIPPDAISAEFRDEWEVIVTMENGATVKFSYDASGALREVTGLTGPFEYDLTISGEFIKYSHARRISIEAVGNTPSGVKGTVTAWQFEKESLTRGYQYRFEVQSDKLYEVRLNASTGKVIRVRER